MPARLRTLLLKTPVLIALGLLAFWFLFAYLLFPPLAKWGAEKYIADKTGHVLTLGEARLDPLRLALSLRDLKLAEPDGKPLLAFAELHVDFEASSLFRWAWTLDDIRLTGPEARVELHPDGRFNWAAFLEAFKDEEKVDKPLPRLLIRHIAVEQGRVAFVDGKVAGGFETELTPIAFELTELSTLPDDKGSYAFSTRTQDGVRIRWKGGLALNPLQAEGELEVEDVPLARLGPYAKPAGVELPAGKAGLDLAYRLRYDDKRLALTLDRLGLKLAGLTLRGVGLPTVTAGSLALSGERLVLEGGVEQPWHLNAERLGLDGAGLRYTDAGFERPLTVEAGKLQLALKAQAELGAGAPQVRLEAIGVQLADLKLQSAGAKAALFQLGSLAMEGGEVDLAKRQARLAAVRLNGGRTQLVRDAQGRLPLIEALKRKPAGKAAPVAQKSGSPWRYAVERVELAGFQVGVRDEGVRPALAVDLNDIRASVEGLSQDLGASLPVKLALRVQQGGAFEAQGSVVPAAPSADLKIKLAGLSLRPAQPYLAQAANLSLAKGWAATSGRLRYGKGLDYQGSFGVTNLLLNESASGKPFLSWRSLGTNRLRLSPERLHIGTLKVDGLGAELLIDADKSVNLKKILKPAPADRSAPPTKAGQGKPFRVDIDSVRVTNGAMDFADLSLVLPFGTHIHDLQGQLNGISSRPGRNAQLELEGKVDEYGLARASGQLNLFDPTNHLDIRTVFRNVEMTRLTPYTATFAGRKIESGKLSLDLQYQIKARQLTGDNQVIMDRLTLGERVESPTAKNLPLDLAIAILSDSDGRIDLGLPVSGSLDDPKFSYGQIIWKAITNVITKIVTAPFRALGKLLGVSGEKLEAIAFDPGSARLLPPEREKLKNIAQALAKRPQLALAVAGTWDPVVDRGQVKERQLRQAVAVGLGLKLTEGEAAPPVDTADPEAQAVIETLFEKRLGREAMGRLKAHYYQANPERQPAMGKMLSTLTGLFKKEAPPTPQEIEALKGTDLHEQMYRRLHEHEPVPDAVLEALARARAEAMRDELVKVNGVDPARLTLEAPRKVEGSGASVVVALGVAVARPVEAVQSAPSPAPQAPNPAPQPAN